MELDLQRLKDERIAKGLSQEDMAKALGWETRTPYAKRENGFVSIGANELIRIVEVLGYSQNEVGIFFKSVVPKQEQ